MSNRSGRPVAHPVVFQSLRHAGMRCGDFAEPVQEEGETLGSRDSLEPEKPLTIAAHGVLWLGVVGAKCVANRDDGGLPTNSGPGVTWTRIIERSSAR